MAATMQIIEGPDKMAAVYYEDRVYYGDVANGTPSGRGLMVFNDGRIAAGVFEAGFLHGSAVRTDDNGSWSAGQFRSGVISTGVYRQRDRIYVGSFSDGRLKDGCLIDENESRIGKFQDSTLHGSGVAIRKADNYVVIGYFARGYLNGPGLRVQQANVEMGRFQENQLYGEALKKTDTELYEGDFLAGKYNGKGFKIAKDEDYSGFFKKGEYFGLGYLRTNGSIVQTQFGVTERCKGRIIFQDGALYQGELSGNVPDGDGVIEYAYQKYEGYISKGKRNGRGTYTYPNGLQIYGYWSYDCLQGECKLSYLGLSVTCHAEAGKVVGLAGLAIEQSIGTEYRLRLY